MVVSIFTTSVGAVDTSVNTSETPEISSLLARYVIDIAEKTITMPDTTPILSE